MRVGIGRDSSAPPHQRIRECATAADILSSEVGVPKGALLCALLVGDGWTLTENRVRTPAWLIEYAVDMPYSSAPAYLKTVADSVINTQKQFSIIRWNDNHTLMIEDHHDQQV